MTTMNRTTNFPLRMFLHSVLLLVWLLMKPFELLSALLKGWSKQNGSVIAKTLLLLPELCISMLTGLVTLIQNKIDVGDNLQSMATEYEHVQNEPTQFTNKFKKRPPVDPKQKKDKKSVGSAQHKKRDTNADILKKKAEHSKNHFAEDLRKKNSDLLYLVRGKDRGREAWHYVLVDRQKLPIFNKKTNGGSLDVADYGEVLYSGWGSKPSLDIRVKIFEEFGGTDPRLEENADTENK